MKLLTKKQEVDLHINLQDKKQPGVFQKHVLDELSMVGLTEPIENTGSPYLDIYVYGVSLKNLQSHKYGDYYS
jgi:hypothetical protein